MLSVRRPLPMQAGLLGVDMNLESAQRVALVLLPSILRLHANLESAQPSETVQPELEQELDVGAMPAQESTAAGASSASAKRKGLLERMRALWSHSSGS